MDRQIERTPQLDFLAARYVWWNDADWAYAHLDVFLSNVMDLGNWDDIQLLRKTVGDALLKQILLNPPVGNFHQRSWDYWHVKFGISPIPQLPKRKL